MASSGRNIRGIRKVLIANRGEIACRIARTLRTMGIKTAAVYSDADRGARHVEEADESYYIGPAEAAKSYLDQKTLITAAKEAGAAAIHPGYGFLSENGDFAAKVEKAGIIFIGPSAKTIRLCGDKLKAKALARAVKVPTVPGVNITARSGAADLKKFLKQQGFPVLVKAAAGGGGRGMRKVFTQALLDDALESARREANAAFGKDELFVEKLVTHARHVEVQILGDKHGKVTHLFDRDCSLQRNHQKIVEEAPAPDISSTVRLALHDAAVKIASAAGYSSAGTAEFLLDQDENFYFLEMNSRLQVEHTVTEAITGLDIVKLQIEIAQGKKLREILPLKLAAQGHAIECRLCAESPEDNFRPSSGRVDLLRVAARDRLPFVRFDSGYRSGDTISHYYDSLVGKLIVAGEDRSEAIENSREALASLTFTGVLSNQALLLELLNSKAFEDCEQHTEYIGQNLGGKQAQLRNVLVASARLLFDMTHAEEESGPRDAWSSAAGFRLAGRAPIAGNYKLNGGAEINVTLKPVGELAFEACAGQTSVNIKCRRKGNEIRLETAGKKYRFYLGNFPSGEWIYGSLGSFRIEESRPSLKAKIKGAEALAPDIRSTLPGKVVSLKVKKGVRVTRGDTLLVIESMKMEHPIVAPASGKVLKIPAIEGKNVEAGEALITLEYDSK